MLNGTPNEFTTFNGVPNNGVAMLEYRYDVPFEFTGTLDKLTFKLGSETTAAPDPIEAPER